VIAHARQRFRLKLALGFHASCGAFLSYSCSIPASESVKPRIHAEVGRYRVRLAQSNEDRVAACRLRFRVFNIELGEGLESSYETGLDTDQFDKVCEHLLVEDKSEENPSRRIVGTYRMQSGPRPRATWVLLGAGVQLRPVRAAPGRYLELGRASIDREHRTPEVLTLVEGYRAVC